MNTKKLYYYNDALELTEYIPPKYKSLQQIILIILFAMTIFMAGIYFGYVANRVETTSNTGVIMYEDSTTMIRTNVSVNTIKYDLLNINADSYDNR